MNRTLRFLLLAPALLMLATTAFCDPADDYFDSGGTKLDRGDMDGAISDYSKAIELKPDLVEAYSNRGIAKKHKGDLDGAIADYTKAIDLKPDFVKAYNNRGMAKKAKGDLDAAIADFTKAVELKPDYARAYLDRGSLYYDARHFTNALVDFRKVIELDNLSDVAEYGRFGVWLIRARLGGAKAATEELQTYLAGRTTGKADDWESRIGHFLADQLTEPEFLATAKNADPETEAGQLCEAYFYAGSKRLFAGDKAQALDYLKKSIATNQKSYSEYDDAAAELKNLNVAVHTPVTTSAPLTDSQTPKPNPDSLDSAYPFRYNNRGIAKMTANDFKGAIADFTKFIELKPDYADVYKDRGYAKEAIGDLNGAKADYKKALELKPGYDEAQRALDELTGQTHQKARR